MRLATILAILFGAALVAALGISYPMWRDRIFPAPTVPSDEEHDHDHDENQVRLSPQARANLDLKAEPIELDRHWRTIQVPGVIVDRPGGGDHGVPAPVAGVVTKIVAQPGRAVRPGDELMSLRIVSEYVQTSQAELFKTTRELKMTQETKERLAPAARTGSIPEARMIELDNQERRLTATIQALRHTLLARGLMPAQVQGVAEGRFITDVTIRAPILPDSDEEPAESLAQDGPETARVESHSYEIQKLNVRLGEQVQAGQTLVYLHDHHRLYVEGHAFPIEAALLEEAWRKRLPVEMELVGGEDGTWPRLPDNLRIEYMANTVDPDSRTLDFYVPLPNQSREVMQDGRTASVWRFRPGQRVRLLVKVEEFADAFVLPPAAVVRDGPEAYVFRQNGQVFERTPVHVLFEDRRAVVVADDGSISKGQTIVRNGAAALNRVLKAQSADESGHGHDHPH